MKTNELVAGHAGPMIAMLLNTTDEDRGYKVDRQTTDGQGQSTQPTSPRAEVI